MNMIIKTHILGPLENNTFLLVDSQTKQAALVDPAFNSKEIISEFKENHWTLTYILCTHAHFDHIAGINEIGELITPETQICLHEKDLPLWQNSGGANQFGLTFTPLTQPNLFVDENTVLHLGEHRIEIRFTPGHSPGHVVYYLPDSDIVFCGDLIFRQSVGRTDLPGGSHLLLLRSIDKQIKPLPDNTRLLNGHGPETTIGYEKKYNPYL